MNEGTYLLAAIGRLISQSCLAAVGWWVCLAGASQTEMTAGVVLITAVYPLAVLGLQASVEWQPVRRGPVGIFTEAADLLAILVGLSPLAYGLQQLALGVWQTYECAKLYYGSDAWYCAWESLAASVSLFQVYLMVVVLISLLLQVQRCAQAAPEPPPLKEAEPMRTHHYFLLHLGLAFGVWGLCFTWAVDAEVGWTRLETQTGFWVLAAFAAWLTAVSQHCLRQRKSRHHQEGAVAHKALA